MSSFENMITALKQSGNPAQEFAQDAKAASLVFMNSVMSRLSSQVRKNLDGLVLKSRSGTLLSKVMQSVNYYQVGNETFGEIDTGTDYGTMWELTGRRGYTIFPKTKKALKIPITDIGRANWGGQFESADRAGGFVFAKKAYIPSAAPRPFILPALEKLDDWIQRNHGQFFLKAFPNIVVSVNMQLRGRG